MKKQNGITLIALVITIIVLLILASVSISAVIGENGIAIKAKEAKQNTVVAQDQEKIEVAIAEYQMDASNGFAMTLEEFLDAKEWCSAVLDEDGTLRITMSSGREFELDVDGNLTVVQAENNGSNDSDSGENNTGDDNENNTGNDGGSDTGTSEVDWDTLVAEMPSKYSEYLEEAQAQKQSISTDIALGTDGKVVNLDLWGYYLNDSKNGMVLGSLSVLDSGYAKSNISGGKIKGTMPQYIYLLAENKVYPVTELCYTFNNVDTLAECPEIPSTVTAIDAYAFSGCTSLTSIKIPDTITTIGNYAFYESGLTSLVLPSKVKILGNFAFSNCKNLASIKVDENNTVFDSRDNCNAIIKTSTNTLIAGCSSTTFPSTVTKIGADAFCGSGLVSITIPSTIKVIEYKTETGYYFQSFAFRECENLESVYFEHETAPTFNEYAFYKSKGVATTFYFKNETVATAFSSISNIYKSGFGTVSTEYDW